MDYRIDYREISVVLKVCNWTNKIIFEIVNKRVLQLHENFFDFSLMNLLYKLPHEYSRLENELHVYFNKLSFSNFHFIPGQIINILSEYPQFFCWHYNYCARNIQRSWKKYLLDKEKKEKVKVIQKYWKTCISDPNYKICRNRLIYEFNNI